MSIPVVQDVYRAPGLAGTSSRERTGARCPIAAPTACVGRRSTLERSILELSVVIPVLNEERHVGHLLTDLARQSRRPSEVIVVDGGSGDGTAEVVSGFPGVELVEGSPPVASGRNLGAQRAKGEALVFLDADVRLEDDFLKEFVGELDRRGLDLACPAYFPHRSSRRSDRATERLHELFNTLSRTFQNTLPVGGGACLAVRSEAFSGSGGFDPSLKFDDAELVRRLSRGHRFGMVDRRVFVSDRRYREQGLLRPLMQQLLLSLFFAFGAFRLANHVDYEMEGDTDV